MTKKEAIKIAKLELGRRVEKGRLHQVIRKTHRELLKSEQEMRELSVYCN